MAENMKKREFVEIVSEECNKKKRKLGTENDVVESDESESLRVVTDLEIVDDDDLKVKADCETEFSREKSPTSELSGEESDSSSTSSKKKASSKPSRRIATRTMPSEAELEEFFAAEEKYQQKQFAEKYNFDVVKDVPLEGKYQWVRLQ